MRCPPANFSRSFKPRYGPIQLVQEITNHGRLIGSTTGKSYPLRYAKPVPADSTDAEPQVATRSAVHTDRAVRELRPFANRTAVRFRGMTITLRTIAGCLRTEAGFDAATRRARIRQRSRVVGFLRNFPELFTITSFMGRGQLEVA